MKLNATDAAELTEMLQFLTGWLTRDPAPPRCIAGRVHRPPCLQPGRTARRPGTDHLPARRRRTTLRPM